MTDYSPHVTDPIVQAELQRVAQILISLGEHVWTEEFNEPEKPRKGMVRFADGNIWDPGSGAGMYLYNGASWNFLQGAGGSGETNTSSNSGIGETLALAKVGVNLPFRTLVAGSNMTIMPTGVTLTLSADNDGATQLIELSDVAAAVPTNRFALIANGANFVSRFLTEADISNLGNYLTDVVAGDVDSESSIDGYVLTSDGADNAAWEAPAPGGTDFLDITEFDDTDGTYYFYGGEDLATDWKINRYQKTTFVKESADEIGNGSYQTLAAAWPDRLTLSYS